MGSVSAEPYPQGPSTEGCPYTGTSESHVLAPPYGVGDGEQLELLRSLIFVPGNRANMLERATGFPADVIMVDLEDSVPPGEKLSLIHI